MESLGVETPDKNTLIFHLSKPCVYFLELLRLPVYTPSYSKYAKETGSGWDKNPETSLSNGPFYLEKYVPEQYFVLKKNERYWNADAVHLERITYRFFEEQQAMLSAYETKEVDVAVSLPSVVMELYQGKDDLVVTDNIATRYIYPNLDVKPLDDVRVREAINLAINREDLCKMVGEDTEPTVNFVAKRMKNNTTGEYFVEEADPPFEENVEKSRELLSQAGYPDGKGFPVLTYKYPSLELDADTAQVIQEQLKQNLNIEIKLEAQELQTNYATRRAGNFDLCRGETPKGDQTGRTPHLRRGTAGDDRFRRNAARDRERFGREHVCGTPVGSGNDRQNRRRQHGTGVAVLGGKRHSPGRENAQYYFGRMP